MMAAAPLLPPLQPPPLNMILCDNEWLALHELRNMNILRKATFVASRNAHQVWRYLPVYALIGFAVMSIALGTVPDLDTIIGCPVPLDETVDLAVLQALETRNLAAFDQTWREIAKSHTTTPKIYQPIEEAHAYLCVWSRLVKALPRIGIAPMDVSENVTTTLVINSYQRMGYAFLARLPDNVFGEVAAGSFVLACLFTGPPLVSLIGLLGFALLFLIVLLCVLVVFTLAVFTSELLALPIDYFITGNTLDLRYNRLVDKYIVDSAVSHTKQING